MKVIISIIEKRKIIEYLQDGSVALEGMECQERNNFVKRSQKYFLMIEKLYYRVDENSSRLVVANDDTEAQTILFEQMHLPDHTGMKAMYERSKNLYIGFKRENLNKYVSNCVFCNRHRPLVRVAPIIPILSDFPWQLVQMDCIDLRNYTEFNEGYGWIVNILDSYSKFMFPVAVKNKTAENIKGALKLQIDREGSPRIIQTDNGKEFANSLFISYLNELNIDFKRGRPRHPQNQGQVERANQTLVRKIAKFLSDKPVKRWIDILPDIVAKYNKTWNRAINKTPMEAFRGRTGFNSSGFVELDSDEIEELDEDSDFVANLDYSAETMNNIGGEDLIVVNGNESFMVDLEYRNRYVERMQRDVDVHYHSIQFNPGDFVLVKRDFDMNPQTRRRKMDDFYEEGTWIILERVGSDSYKIKNRENESIVKTICKNRIKKLNS